MGNSQKVRGVMIYTYDMHLNGLDFYEFLIHAKRQLLSDLAGYVSESFEGKITIETLTCEEIFDEAIKYRRADGQFYLQGELTSARDIRQKIYAYSRKIVMEALTPPITDGG